jgi:hypothetical protein
MKNHSLKYSSYTYWAEKADKHFNRIVKESIESHLTGRQLQASMPQLKEPVAEFGSKNFVDK